MRRSPGIAPLTVVQVAAVKESTETPWLIRELWAEEGVGIMGGAPKSLKTWLALEMALSVATGKPALDHYAVEKAGPVLVFCAEDGPEAVRRRLEGLARRHDVCLRSTPLHLILTPSLRLDTETDQERLRDAVARHQPRLLVLDPFVRLHRIDENSALEVSRVLAYLRELQREQHVAILVVHHARKATGSIDHAGLALRGSSDLYAFGDSYLYLRKHKDHLVLAAEHRGAPAPAPVHLVLRTDPDRPPYLAVSSCEDSSVRASLKERILALLHERDHPLNQDAMREALKVRMQTLVDALRELRAEQRVSKTAAGWIPAGNQQEEDTGRSGGGGGDTAAKE